MNRIVVTLATAFAVGVVVVPATLAEDGSPAKREPRSKPAVTCARTSLGGRITRVGTDAVAVRPGESETGRPLVVGVTTETVVKQGDVVVDLSALAPGQRARFLVHACRSGDRKVMTALAILLAKRVDAGAGTGTTPAEPRKDPEPKPTPEPESKPTQETCGQGELNTTLLVVSPGSVTVRTTSAEGTKEWPVAITADTVIRKDDQSVPVSTLRIGDLVHVVLVRCSSGSVRALRIVVLQAAAPA